MSQDQAVLNTTVAAFLIVSYKYYCRLLDSQFKSDVATIDYFQVYAITNLVVTHEFKSEFLVENFEMRTSEGRKKTVRRGRMDE